MGVLICVIGLGDRWVSLFALLVWVIDGCLYLRLFAFLFALFAQRLFAHCLGDRWVSLFAPLICAKQSELTKYFMDQFCYLDRACRNIIPRTIKRLLVHGSACRRFNENDRYS